MSKLTLGTMNEFFSPSDKFSLAIFFEKLMNMSSSIDFTSDRQILTSDKLGEYEEM
ncbi:hypothetical protein [Iningainema tapete]|uniref:hypothetical protein n=1 Tax=Iningainema tapete TaxID=2806730 RepID=UPI0030D87B4D